MKKYIILLISCLLSLVACVEVPDYNNTPCPNGVGGSNNSTTSNSTVGSTVSSSVATSASGTGGSGGGKMCPAKCYTCADWLASPHVVDLQLNYMCPDSLDVRSNIENCAIAVSAECKDIKQMQEISPTCWIPVVYLCRVEAKACLAASMTQIE